MCLHAERDFVLIKGLSSNGGLRRCHTNWRLAPRMGAFMFLHVEQRCELIIACVSSDGGLRCHMHWRHAL